MHALSVILGLYQNVCQNCVATIGAMCFSCVALVAAHFLFCEENVMSTAFGEHLRKLRKSNTNFTQEDMAEKLNISRSTYTYYETGKSEPCLSSIRIMCRLFKVDFNTIFDYDEK